MCHLAAWRKAATGPPLGLFGGGALASPLLLDQSQSRDVFSCTHEHVNARTHTHLDTRTQTCGRSQLSRSIGWGMGPRWDVDVIEVGASGGGTWGGARREANPSAGTKVLVLELVLVLVLVLIL